MDLLQALAMLWARHCLVKVQWDNALAEYRVELLTIHLHKVVVKTIIQSEEQLLPWLIEQLDKLINSEVQKTDL